jgi:SAM-dependent methyltransferase
MPGDSQPGNPPGDPQPGDPQPGDPESSGAESSGADSWRSDNRAHWDEATALHAGSDFYDLDGFRAGRDDLRPFEDGELGGVADLDLVHLQCHLGTDTLSLARRGARVVGLDFSAESVAAATALAADCGLAAEFVCADVYDAPRALGGRTFDVVYTGVGALCWLPDLDRWAAVVAALLRPGGILYLVEVHPLTQAVWPDGRTITEDMMGAGFRREDAVGDDYAVPGVPLAATVTWARNWSVAEVVTAVLGAGLRLELLGEQDVTDNPLPWLERGADRLCRFPAGFPRYPLTFSIRARAPGR